jgi:hypothetical protein
MLVGLEVEWFRAIQSFAVFATIDAPSNIGILNRLTKTGRLLGRYHRVGTLKDI